MGLLDNIKDAVGMGDEESKPADAQAEREQAVAEAQQRAEAAQAAQAEQAARNEAEAKARQAGREAAEAEAAAQAAADAAAQEAAAQEAAAAAAAAAAAPQPETYTVVSGDTLSAIGERYGVSYQAIAQANGIENPDLIYPGQVFTIPR